MKGTLAWAASALLVLLASSTTGCDFFASDSGTGAADGAVSDGMAGDSTADDSAAPADSAAPPDTGAPTFLTSVEDELLAEINTERNAAGLPTLVRDPGLDRVIQWHVAGMEAGHFLGHDDANGRRGEGRARYCGGDGGVRCSEIIQWWGGSPSGRVHYQGYLDSPPHHDAYMEVGAFNLGPTMHAGVGAIRGTGPTGSMFEGRSGSYTGVLFCDGPITLAIDPFSEP